MKLELEKEIKSLRAYLGTMITAADENFEELGDQDDAGQSWSDLDLADASLMADKMADVGRDFEKRLSAFLRSNKNALRPEELSRLREAAWLAQTGSELFSTITGKIVKDIDQRVQESGKTGSVRVLIKQPSAEEAGGRAILWSEQHAGQSGMIETVVKSGQKFYLKTVKGGMACYRNAWTDLFYATNVSEIKVMVLTAEQSEAFQETTAAWAKPVRQSIVEEAKKAADKTACRVEVYDDSNVLVFASEPAPWLVHSVVSTALRGVRRATMNPGYSPEEIRMFEQIWHLK